MVCQSAPGKVILFGEHAVVYGRPAIAAPVSQVRATAVVQASAAPGIRLLAPDLNVDMLMDQLPPDDPLAATLHHIQRAANLAQLPHMIITVPVQTAV